MEKKDINTVEEENIKDEGNATEASATTDNVTEDAPSTDNEAENKVETDPLEAANAEIERLKTELLYKQAEFDNFRKRSMKEKAEIILQGGEKVVIAILPVLDDFERALKDTSDDPEAIRAGQQLIFNKLAKTMEQLGVKKIETDNADFNTDYHEAVAHVPGMGDDKKNKVIDCIQTGYTLNDKVIRYAKVAVGM